MAQIIGEIIGIKNDVEIQWTISDFFQIPEEKDVKFNSPDFYFADATWYLQMYPFGNSRNDSTGSIGCYLQIRDSIRPVNLECELGLMKTDGSIDVECKYVKTFDENVSSWGCKRFIDRSKLLTRKPDLAPSNVLTFVCRMTRNKPNIAPSLLLFKRTKKVTDDLRNLMLNGNDSDLILRLKEKEFKLHKNILRIRSPVFATMVTQKMEENFLNILDIYDCEEDVFKMFLEYVYTGTVIDLSKKNFFGLYKIAEKYEVTELREDCLQCIKDTLSTDTFFDTVELAENYEEKDLKSLTSKFCSDNLKDLVKNPKWMTFMQEYTKKAYELLSGALDNYVKS